MQVAGQGCFIICGSVMSFLFISSETKESLVRFRAQCIFKFVYGGKYSLSVTLRRGLHNLYTP
jgi:hypothetical protein